MADGYVELHAKSFYSFGVGASHVHELLAQAREYGYPALALTDTNLCGALDKSLAREGRRSQRKNGLVLIRSAHVRALWYIMWR